MSALPQYSVEVKGAPEIPGEGKPRRNAVFPDELLKHPPNVDTMWENFLHGFKESSNENCLGHRKIVDGVAGAYIWESWTEVKNRVENFGAGLAKLGLEYQKPLGFFSVNRPEWTMGEQACYKHGFINVALYDTLGTEAVIFIMHQTEMAYILGSADKISRILSLKSQLPNVKYFISMDDEWDESVKSKAEEVGVQIISFRDVEKLGKDEPKDNVRLSLSEDIATICYTSGTTGLPKGAVLTHSNCLGLCSSTTALGEKNVFALVTKTDSYISYLPLAHVLERAAQSLFIYRGASIGYYQGDTIKLLDDVAELKPTVFVSVPRLFNRIYDKVLAGVKAKGGVTSFLFFTAFNAKKEGLKNGHVTHFLWDKTVFGQVRQRLGGRVRFMLSGSAPISPEVLDFLRICFSAEMYEGYGQTENFCSSCLTIRGDTTSGVVGAPFPCSEIKLVDVPDMEYTSKDTPYPRGEICVRGSSVMREYYKNPEKTAEAIDADRWLHTGDIGMWDEQGRLKIIDRLKNIFKLAQGEYIAPEKIEGIYQKHELVSMAFVYGDSLQSTVVGIIVPDKSALVKWASKQPELANKEYSDLIADPAVKKHMLQSITSFGKVNDLKGFENIKAIHIEEHEFSVDNDMLTPTFKLKRDIAKKHYRTQIDQMYAEINSHSSGRD